MVRFLLVSIAWVNFVCVSGQNDQAQIQEDPITLSNGSLELLVSGKDKSGLNMIHDARLDSLFLLQKEVNLVKNGIDGYRVQMFSGNQQGNSKIRAREIQGMVLTEFPQLEVEVIYQPPFWRVQVGRYRMRNEAMKTQRMLLEKFGEMENYISIVHKTIDYPRIEKDIEINNTISVQ